MKMIGFLLLIVHLSVRAQAAATKEDELLFNKAGWSVHTTQNGDQYELYAGGKKRLPLVLVIQGSGCDSVFHKKDDTIATTGIHGLIAKLAPGKAHIVVTDKPGIPLFFDGRNSMAETCPKNFLSAFDFETWVSKLARVLKDAQKNPLVDANRVVVVGHSEGGEVAAHLAAKVKIVTDVACLASSNQSQLADFLALAKSSAKKEGKSEEEGITNLFIEWDQVLAHRNEIDKFFLGHSYRYWAKKFSKRPVDSLKRTKAKIFLASGTIDSAVPIESFESTIAELRAVGKKYDFLRVEGADHAFAKRGQSDLDGLSFISEKFFSWLKL